MVTVSSMLGRIMSLIPVINRRVVIDEKFVRIGIVLSKFQLHLGGSQEIC